MVRSRGRPSREDVLRTLDKAIEDLSSVGGLPLPVEADAIWEGIWYEEAHHSTAIEGNTLVLKEVEQLLREGKAVGSKELAEYLEVEGYAKAAQWVYAQAVEQPLDWSAGDRISLTELRQIHRLVVEPAWLHSPPEGLHQREGPVSFRQHDIRPFTGGMTPPPFPEVPALVTDWLRDARRGPADAQHPMQFVADIHARFERIHPFRDGNGSVGRLATNLLLVRHGFPPAVIRKRDRTRYLDALRRADRGDAGRLAEIFARAVTDGIYRFLLPGLAGPHRLVPLRSLADSELSGNALAVAAKRHRLRAVRRTDQWYSTRQWVQDYKDSRYKRA
ncbi:MAG: Fic family protein [Actinobacteria bacterium]|nr:Fic family protein [Actinomycetota bacterium]